MFPSAGALAGSPSCLISPLKSMSGRAERLTSPSVFLGVRDLHSNGWALSTGEPDEEQSRVVVLLPHAAPAFCYSPPPAPVSLHFVSVAAGWRQMIVVWGRPSCCLHVCAYVCPSARLCYGWKQYVCVCVCVCVSVCVCVCVCVCLCAWWGQEVVH